MKKLFLFVALFTWIGFSASAQITRDTATTETRTDTETRTKTKMEPRLDNIDPQLDNMQINHPQIDSSKMHSMKHHWVFRDGKVMEVKDGKEQEITTETQVNDVWIRANGQIVMKDGEIVDLKEGQYLDKEGKIHDKEKEREVK